MAQNAKTGGRKYVSRIDQADRNHHGWYVRVRASGELVSKFFRDGGYGGRAKALRAAVAFRDSTLEGSGRSASGRMVVSRTSRNTSGIVGVARQTMLSRDGRTETSYWVASWSPEPGQLKRKFYSVRTFGEKGALLAAYAFRRDREREIYGTEIRENWAAAAKVLLSL